MNQKIRNNTFETNSSSVHSIVLQRRLPLDPESTTDYNFHIRLLDTTPTYKLKTPEDVVSYLYTTAVVTHNWKLYDLLMNTYKDCIFQKPLYYMEHLQCYDYCDDRRITSFCDTNLNFNAPQLDEKQLQHIYSHLENIVSFGFIQIATDKSYKDEIVENFDNSDGIYKDAEAYIKSYYTVMIEG